MNEIKNFDNVLCSVQRALSSNITENLRAVYVLCESERNFHLTFYFDKAFSEDEEENCSIIDAEFASDFTPPYYHVSYSVKVIPYPDKINDNGRCVYYRYESNFQNSSTEFFELNKKVKCDHPYGNLSCTMGWALLGNVTHNLRSIDVNDSNNTIKLNFVFDQPLSDVDTKCYNRILSKFIEEYPSPSYNVSSKINIIPYPNRFLNESRCLFRRFEPFID